ncbi:uncharacterized protein LOC135712488 [Ochlerotatus camptorhynchus]|uniref:uncharacterized protein LOC135712488 n=1 Tax=Ochlerotatus camptorhynchus TaxID=644619 RepID=UPI0031DF9681
MLKRFSARKNGITKQTFARASRNYRSYNRYLYGRYVRRVQDNLRRNPKQYWNFVNTKRNESGLPSTMRMEDQSASTAEAKCELFAARFASVFQASTASPSDVETATRSLLVDAFDIDIFDVSQTMVENALKKLKSSVSPGPDGIPACILKKCSGMLITPLQAIFNLSLRSQQFPIAWKMSYIQPIFKKGSKVDVSNYRGITLLSAGSK